VRHRVRGTAYLSWQNDQGPSIGTIKPLENSLISLTGDWRSGVPYTVSDRNGNPLGETNANNQPDYWRVDARVSKSFNLEDWFGKRMAGTKLEIYVDMYNVTNRRAITGFYTATGDPVDDGSSLDRKIGDFSAIPYYQTANPENPSSYASNQYDDYGVRLYNEIADFNSDGVITQQEKYQSYINYLEVAMKSLGNFQAPFTIYGGVSFIF
jgi:hypothetical protein